MKNKAPMVLLMLATLSTLSVPQALSAPPATPDNPRPADEDVLLPMPDGEMAFRPVWVPGQDFWGGSERIIQLGDANGGMFEGLQRVQINGSFPGPAHKGWVCYIGKYEVTKRQFAAVMGIDALAAQSANPKDRALPKLSGRALEDALSEPLSGVSASAVEAFVYAYNQWLFDPAHPERMHQLPKLDQVPGYLRLPTEVEWEYAARGGYEAMKAGTFNDSLPFPQGSAVKFAWIRDNARAKIRPVGLRESDALGLYDMLGNVQELTSQRFQPEMWQGKPGGLVARGGSVLTSSKDLRSSNRAEVGEFRWNPDKKRMDEQKSLTTGARLAIGSDVVVSTQYWKELEDAYKAYKTSIRAQTPIGRTLAHPVSQGASAMGLAHTSIDQLMTKNKSLATELAQVKRYIEQAEVKMDQAQREAARSLAQDALRNAVNAGAYIFSARQLDGKAKDLESMVKQLGSRFKANLDLLKDKAKEKNSLAKAQLDGYSRKVSELGEYGSNYVDGALATLKSKSLSTREQIALELLTRHVAQYRVSRRVSMEEWSHDFEKHYSNVTQ